MQYSVHFPSGEVHYYFDSFETAIGGIVQKGETVVITDTHVHQYHGHLLAGFKDVIVLPAGEAHKHMDTVLAIVQKLADRECDRTTFVLGVGGGVVTDVTGFAASVYMRGVKFGFVPTTLLGMADAAIGGKNGVNYKLQKNLLGTIVQPAFILTDISLLQTLPQQEWSNGFAEVIKYACLFDAPMFEELERHDLDYYRQDKAALKQLVLRCTEWKNRTVQADEKEGSMRKLLNFGHTAGHAIETLYKLPHGFAVSLGMIVACILSEEINGTGKNIRQRLVKLLQKYGLPVAQMIDAAAVTEILKLDKKRSGRHIDFILLNSIGDAAIKALDIEVIKKALETFNNDAGNS